MSLRNDLENRVSSTFKSSWQYVDARVVPETKSIGMGNHGKNLTATVLYADLDSSTALVKNYKREFAAEVYKVFLYCASRLIASEGGEIRSFDGDRVMGVFDGDTPNTDAVKAALKINYAVKEIISPRLLLQYPGTKYGLKHTVGIDCSDILVIRGGVRDNNDLAWIGNAANIAAKLNSLPSEYPTWITHRVFDKMADKAKFGGSPKRSMWEECSWTPMDGMRIYRSNWKWKVS
ncbi:adenylate/guanylate cyclase domain-containing protein [Phaeobacter sp.]|uniref:adenylate/guanylate cyclase domain-containing protein n=1 Tax=Phaeobacter sp. TaxID=1902409 RepID=UPI0025D3AEE6|nr:adenylate/guanylate cyclase domain-containing protein [Phaeobacter sp.]